MKIAALIEPIPGKGYRVRGGEPFNIVAQGSTKEEALNNFRDLVVARLDDGVELVSVDVPSSENPWRVAAGMFKDDPLFDEWQAAIAEKRQDSD